MKRYSTILADPPWPIKWSHSDAIRTRHLEYNTLPISEICALDVRKLALDDCTLFLWTTNSFLPEALGVVRHWGFHYKMLFTWCKRNGMGGHPRNATEHIVIATRGQPKGDRHAPALLNWICESASKHSAKPEVIRGMIERISPAPRLELFARSKWHGWDAWGDEIQSDLDVGFRPEIAAAQPAFDLTS